ncbi:hypothetical protein Mapa_002280 [Marchantia paleacea]|nr:hypothetical protein Mapa_002280 [Marchantia paleacea]
MYVYIFYTHTWMSSRDSFSNLLIQDSTSHGILTVSFRTSTPLNPIQQELSLSHSNR